MKPNPWERNLAEGQRAHEIAMDKLKSWSLRMRIEDYSRNMEKQRAGMDAAIVWDKTTFDTKARSYNTREDMCSGGDIPIEILSIIETGKAGWYFTSKADFISYVWWNPKKTDLYEGYLIALQDTKFRNFFENNIDKLRLKRAESVAEGARIWHTLNSVMPISIFPKATIFKFIEPPGKGWGFHGKIRLNHFIERAVKS